MDKKQPKFNYAVGQYWEGESGSVGCYAFGSEVHYGTTEEANNFLNYVKGKEKEKPVEDRKDYRIFMLVELTQG
jgi:hypothetical protein